MHLLFSGFNGTWDKKFKTKIRDMKKCFFHYKLFQDFPRLLTICLSHQKQHLIVPIRTPHNGFSLGGLIIAAANFLLFLASTCWFTMSLSYSNICVLPWAQHFLKSWLVYLYVVFSITALNLYIEKVDNCGNFIDVKINWKPACVYVSGCILLGPW